MVTVPNLFGPGYDLATLTEAINLIPNLWGRLQDYNLFPAEGIREDPLQPLHGVRHHPEERRLRARHR